MTDSDLRSCVPCVSVITSYQAHFVIRNKSLFKLSFMRALAGHCPKNVHAWRAASFWNTRQLSQLLMPMLRLISWLWMPSSQCTHETQCEERFVPYHKMRLLFLELLAGCNDPMSPPDEQALWRSQHQAHSCLIQVEPKLSQRCRKRRDCTWNCFFARVWG